MLFHYVLEGNHFTFVVAMVVFDCPHVFHC